MFTGIITGLGRITAVEALGADPSHGKRLTIESPAAYLDDVQLGDSIALNGACMTVTTFDPAARRFTIDISAESLDKTAGLATEGPVNLEKALRPSDRLGGHLVSGHVDGVGTVTHFAPVGEVVGTAHRGPDRPRPLPRLQGLHHRQRREPHREPHAKTAPPAASSAST